MPHTTKLARPRALRSGDRVALVAPSSRYDVEALARGVAILESWGLEVETPAETEPVRYLAASDELRASELTEAFTRDDIAAVIGVRGGYGTSRLLGLFDTATARSHPKMFVGYSDMTLLLSRLVSEARLLCFHGPMASTDLPRLGADELVRYRKFLFGEEGWWTGTGLSTVVAGSATGRIVGGCLSVIVTSIGTPYEVDTSGRVLFLEDISEPAYRIDRMLVHLAHAGKLDDVVAVVLGAFHRCEPAEQIPEIFEEIFTPRGVPVVSGLDAGHHSGGGVVPIGCEVRVDADAGTVELLEPVYSAGDAASVRAAR